jgi:hypothetical protein
MRTRTLVTIVVAFVVLTIVLWAALQLFGTRATIERKPGGVERIEDPRDF